MEGLSVILPYYINKGMLKKQVEVFESYPEHQRSRLELIIVDDASPMGSRAEEVDLNPSFRFSIYRILTDLRWNWLQARNIGAKVAIHDWILLTDIDHIIPAETMDVLMQNEFDKRSFYTFLRRNYADNSAYHPHPNSYLMTRKRYWKIGGYDESFAGHYGTDGMWRRRCEEHAAHQTLTAHLLRVDRKDIPDASTTTYERKENRDPQALDSIREYKDKFNIGIQTLRFPWKKVR